MRHSWSSSGRVRIGDLFDVATAPFRAAADVATSAWDDAKKTVPGLQGISDAVDSFTSGPLRDFAKTLPGQVVMVAVSGSIYMAAAPAVGAQVAAVAFATPGMAKGETFVRAWTEGFVQRLTALVAYLIHVGIPADLATTDVGNAASEAFAKCDEYVSQAGLAGLDVKSLAKKAGVREDMAAQYLANAFGDLSIPGRYSWDDATGEGTPYPSWHDVAGKVAAAMRARAAAEQAAKTTGAESRSYAASVLASERRELAGLPPPAVHPSAPDLGALTGAGDAPTVGPPPPSAVDRERKMSAPAKVGLGLGAAALALLFFL